MLRFGICTDQNMPYDTNVERWQYYEALGFDSLWDCDHLVQPSRNNGPYHEGWTLLAALAARTERVRVGVLVSSNTFRHPALLAKEAATVDHISHGRLDLGIGAGWYVPEHEMFGLPFPSPGERVAMFREAVELIDCLLRNEQTTYHGTYYQLNDALFRPAPVQKPRPPFVLGGHQPKMLRIAAEYADTWNSFGTVDEMRHRNAMLDAQCAAIGRDPHAITRSLYGWASMMPQDPWQSVDAFHDCIGKYREAGVNEFILDAPPDAQLPVLERIVAEALPGLRAS